MSTKDELGELKQQVNDMRELLTRLGVNLPRQSGASDHRPDYIEHGSPAHAVFLGLVEVHESDDTSGFTVFRSQQTGKAYRLDDEIGVMVHYPGVDPEKAAILVLRQKINELEGGQPPIQDGAPSVFAQFDGAVIL